MTTNCKSKGAIDALQKQLELRGKLIDKIDDTTLLSLVGIDSSKLNLGHASQQKQQINNNMSLANSQIAYPAQNVYNNNPKYVNPMNQPQIINRLYQQNQKLAQTQNKVPFNGLPQQNMQ